MKILERLKELEGVEAIASDYPSTGVHVDVLMGLTWVRTFASLIREEDFLIESVTAVDAEPNMMVLYHFTHPDELCRVVARVLVERVVKRCPTISDIYPGANWHEREVRDFFGITFEDHPDMTPLILPEDQVDFHPLLKKEKKIKTLSEV
ncbi:MAG: hypothetical protein C0609_01445, partial [Deltaproteobacteria bacterium]